MAKKKKSWKERQRERQVKQQRTQEAYQIRRKIEAERKPRQWPKGKILMAVCSLVLIFGAYGAWQYTKPSAISEEPPPQTPTSEIIYIRADGLVDPSTASILNVGNIYYTFTADIHGSIVIERDNIVVDGANYTLQGTQDYYSIGIYVSERSNVTMTNIKIKDFEYGVYLYSVHHNVFSQNDLTNNINGIGVDDSSNNTIAGNNIANNEEGLYLYRSSENIFHHNNFVGNMHQVYDFSWENATISGSINVWDDGYPSGGNYWSDYEEWYPDAEELDGSGIWNTQYVIDSNNQDNYPLMNPSG